MRVTSPGLPPIGVKLNSTDRRMTTNGSSPFSNASTGMDRADQLISALSSLNLQSGADTCHNSYQSNLMHYLELQRENTAHSPASRTFTHLLENPYAGFNANNIPGLLNRTVNGSPQMPVDMQYLEYMRMAQYAGHTDGPLMDLPRLQQKKQQQYGYYDDHGFLSGFTADSAFPLSPTGDLIGPADFGLMPCPSGLRKLNSFSNVSSHIPTLLEEFKSNKARCYELSEIAGHVVEFRYALIFYLNLVLSDDEGSNVSILCASITPPLLNFLITKFF